MNKFKVGDKVYLEGKISKYDESDNTYCIDYFDYYKNTYSTVWVKDDVLHPTDEFNNIVLKDAWELIRKIVMFEEDGGYSREELGNIFGYRDFESILKVFTPQEALAKVKAYEERDKIKVGDVVKDSVGESLVLRIDDSRVYLLCRDGSCGKYPLSPRFKKTGKHYDSIDEFMRSTDD